ncbi:MAG: TVP38/TMEM64 family protein [Deltaproteobacteria bacterium]|nr:TVP38/TMEM64 family protein [Deltaproteobacteria bacterium]
MSRSPEPAPPEMPPTPPPPARSRLWLLIFLWVSAFVAVIAVSWYICVRVGWWEEVCRWYDVVTNKEMIKVWIEQTGGWAPVIFISIQTLQVVLAPIPGEATGFIGGFLFGVPLGLLYSTIGLTIGSIIAFGLGHWLEKAFVVKMVSQETMDKFDFLMEHQGALVSFIFFLIPGFPKDLLCFILGLSPMSFRLFVVIVTVGRIPGTLMLTLQGAQVYEGNYWESVVLIGLCLLVAGVLYYYREQVYRWIRRLERHLNGGG